MPFFNFYLKALLSRSLKLRPPSWSLKLRLKTMTLGVVLNPLEPGVQ